MTEPVVGQVGGVVGEGAGEVIDDLTEDDVGRRDVEPLHRVEELVPLQRVGTARQVRHGQVVRHVRQLPQLHRREGKPLHWLRVCGAGFFGEVGSLRG